MFLRLLCKRAVLPLAAAVLVSSAFALEGKNVQLTTSDGWEIAGVYQSAQEKNPTVLLLHDIGKNKESFNAFADALAKAGYGYLAIDLRGHGQSTNKGEAYSFAKEGIDNDYNKMSRDVDAAMGFLQKQRLPVEDVVLFGTGLGANVAAKSVSFWPDVYALALISPTANNKDVLAIPSIRLYKGNVLIATAADDKKAFLEASVIRNVAFLTSGAGKVTFLTAYNLAGHAMLDKYLTLAVLQWLSAAQLPEVSPDVVLSAGDEEEIPALPLEQTGNTDVMVPSVIF